MKYSDELCRAMDYLAHDPRTVFLPGEAVACPGTAMTNTLKNVPRPKLLEMPVTEEMQMGIATWPGPGGTGTRDHFSALELFPAARGESGCESPGQTADCFQRRL